MTENTFLCEFDPKNQNFHILLKFYTRPIWICRIIQKIDSVHFFCFGSEKKFEDWVNLVKKLKIVSLSWNLVTRLIWISGIQWWCSLFLFFSTSVFQYLSIFFSSNSNMQNSMVVSILSVLDWKVATLFGIFGPKNRNCQFKLKIDT